MFIRFPEWDPCTQKYLNRYEAGRRENVFETRLDLWLTVPDIPGRQLGPAAD